MRKSHPEHRKKEVGTKLYPEQIEHIDKIAAAMHLTRYKLLQKALTEVFFTRSKPRY